MSYELAIINPRRKSAKRRKASAKQLAARKRFIAKFAKGRRKLKKVTRRAKARKSLATSGVISMAKRKRSRKARSSKGRFVKKSHKSSVKRVKRRRASGKRTTAVGYTVGTKRIRRRKLNPRVKRRRFKRNPIGLPSVSGVLANLVPAAYGAAGAMALNIGLSYLPLPAVMTTGWARHGTRILGALALGYGAKKFLGARGNAVANGALVVAVYDLFKEAANTFAPAIGSRLGEFEDVTLEDGIDYIDPASPISAYLSGDPDNNQGVDGDLDGDLDGIAAYMQGELDGNTLDV